MSKHETTIEDIEARLDRVFDKIGKASHPVAKIKREKIGEPHLMIIDIADLHIGKLAVQSVSNDTYNMDIAYERAVEGVA